jgi:hypothetical protein
MSGLMTKVTSGEIALAAVSTAKTFLLLTAPANHIIKIVGIEVDIKGIVVTDPPVLCELVSSDSSTAGTSSAATIRKKNSNAETVLTTAKKAFTVEPTVLTVLDSWEVHPQTGRIVYPPMYQEWYIPGGGVYGIRLTTPSTGGSPVAVVNMEMEE